MPILHSHSGTSLIASPQCKQNAVIIEKSDVNFIKMTIYIVEKHGKLDEATDNTSNIVEDANNEETRIFNQI